MRERRGSGQVGSEIMNLAHLCSKESLFGSVVVGLQICDKMDECCRDRYVHRALLSLLVCGIQQRLQAAVFHKWCQTGLVERKFLIWTNSCWSLNQAQAREEMTQCQLCPSKMSQVL